MTIEELWEGIDVETDNLDVNILETQEDETGIYCSLEYTSHYVGETPVRVFGYYGYPKKGDGAFPGILHIHGGGQTANLDHVRYWVKAGYGCLSYDWTGPWEDRINFTSFGNADLGDMSTVFSSENLHNNRLFNAAVIARRGITLLKQRAEINGRIGIYGISWGGIVTWIVNGIDSRVNACCPIYGCGGMYKSGHGTQIGYTIPQENYELWYDVMSPEAYSSHQKSPVLMLQATNDFWGWMDQTTSIVSRVRQDKRVAFTPHYNHHIDFETGRDVKHWMDCNLKGIGVFPAGPVVNIISNSSVLSLEILPDRADEVQNMKIYYSVGDYYQAPSISRYWRQVDIEPADKRWIVEILYRSNNATNLFASVKYLNGINLSSLPIRVVPTDKAEIKSVQGSYVIDDFNEKSIGWANSLDIVPTDFIYKGVEFYKVEGPDGNPAITYRHLDSKDNRKYYSFLTHKLGDIENKMYGKDRKFSFRFKGGEGTTLSVEFYCNNWSSCEKMWGAECNVVPNTWSNIILGIEDLLTLKGKDALKDWSQIDSINIKGSCNCGDIPSIALLEWK